MSEVQASLFDHIPIQNCLAYFNASLELLLRRQPDAVMLALEVPNQAKIIREQVGAVGRPNVPKGRAFGGSTARNAWSGFDMCELHHPLPDPLVSNLLLAVGKPS